MRPPKPALLVALALTAVAVGAIATPAGAHNARTAFEGVYGPYDVVATARYVHEPDQQGVMVELILETKETRREVSGAAVSVIGDNGQSTVGPIEAEPFGNAYRMTIPGADVERWNVEIRVDGEPGSATIAETVPGPSALRSVTDPAAGHGSSSIWAWVGIIAALQVGTGVTALSRLWRPVMWGTAFVLLAVCAAALVGAWAPSTASTTGKLLALGPPLLAAATLVVGLVLTQLRRDDGTALVFAGSAGLAVIFGWVNRSFLTAVEVQSTLPAELARATVVVALGLGGGLMLLMAIQYLSGARTRVMERSGA